MNESMRQYMKVGLIHFMAYPTVSKGEGPIEETFYKIAVDDYFEVAEITWMKDPATRKRVKKMIETAHLTVTYGAQPRLLTTGLNINDLNEAGRQQALASLKAGIDEAYEMGATAFAFLSGKYSEESKEEAYQALVQSTKEICAYAKSKGDMKVALEVFDYDVDKKSIIGPVALAKRFAAEITAAYDNFGLMVDLSHLPLLHETPEESLIPIKDYIIHAHMGNCVVKDPSYPAYGDAHPRFGFPNGENDVEELMAYLRVLLSIGFLNKENRPIVSFEVKPFEDEDPDLVIANAKRVLNLAWDKV
ncbi:xylose isomerase [Sporomusaceae bacterium FL31]|nr:xylose isomerase [Sporomusaceae bacterium FL31]GCE35386.1 xylose isomerase [Sporomusaceae bacterium]